MSFVAVSKTRDSIMFDAISARHEWTNLYIYLEVVGDDVVTG